MNSETLPASAAPVVAKTISTMMLNKTYKDWRAILGYSHLKALPKASRRAPTTYEIVQELPTPEAYAALRNAKHKTTVGSLVESASGEIETLKDEMESWADNMPESLQGGSKYDEVNEAKDALEAITVPDLDDKFKDIVVTFHPNYDAEGRPDRAHEASRMLEAAAEAIRNKLDEDRDANDTKDKAGEEVEAIDETDYTTVADELEQAANEVSEVSFPGMF